MVRKAVAASAGTEVELLAPMKLSGAAGVDAVIAVPRESIRSRPVAEAVGWASVETGAMLGSFRPVLLLSGRDSGKLMECFQTTQLSTNAVLVAATLSQSILSQWMRPQSTLALH